MQVTLRRVGEIFGVKQLHLIVQCIGKFFQLYDLQILKTLSLSNVGRPGHVRLESREWEWLQKNWVNYSVWRDELKMFLFMLYDIRDERAALEKLWDDLCEGNFLSDISKLNYFLLDAYRFAESERGRWGLFDMCPTLDLAGRHVSLGPSDIVRTRYFQLGNLHAYLECVMSGDGKSNWTIPYSLLSMQAARSVQWDVFERDRLKGFFF